MNRAYSVLEIKAVDDDARIIEGTATTPAPDRMGDIVEPLGVRFKNPMPLLHQHDSRSPVGTVRFEKPTKDGIKFRAQLPKIAELGALKDRVDTAWGEVKAGLVRAVSIGFRPIEHSMMDDGGYRFIESEVLELSLVTVPANADCTITQIRSIDSELRAASGTPQPSTTPARDRAAKPTPVAAKGAKPVKTIAENIASFEASRAAKAARMDEIMTKAAEEGVTLDAEQADEYDGLETEIKAIDEHLKRLATLQKTQVAAATPVEGVYTIGSGSSVRSATRVEVRGHNLPKGTAFTRYAIALAKSRGNLMQAVEVSKAWHDSTPEVETVLRAAVTEGTTTDATWAAPLVEYQTMAGEFIELLRPATVLGRIPNLRRVPFNISMPQQTAGSSVGWVGEGKAKPVSEMAFTTTTMRWAKAAGIVVLSDELIRFSNPAAESLVRDDLIATMAKFLDEQFLNPDVAAVTNVSPASITNGVTPIASTGVDSDALRADAKSAINAMIAAGLSPAGSVWIMPETVAMAIGMMQNALGQDEYPGLTATGGTFFGLPVITSSTTGLVDGASPSGERIVLVKAPEILLADDGQVMLDSSREASIQMDSEPTEPTAAATVLVSLWQRNLTALRAERWINWQRRRDGAVQYIQGADYGDSP